MEISNLNIISHGRPHSPKDYGVPEHLDTLLPWSFVDERMSAARNYWYATTNPDGSPHTRPLWGAWLDGKLFFEGSPETRWARNLTTNPAMAVHLEDGSQAVILEGKAQMAGKPERSLAELLSQIYTSKYKDQGYAPSSEQWDNGGLYIFQPLTVLAWSRFPDDLTRWKLAP